MSRGVVGIRLKNRVYYDQITLRIKENLHNELKEIIEKYDLISKNAFINDCIEYGIEHLKESKDGKLFFEENEKTDSDGGKIIKLRK